MGNNQCRVQVLSTTFVVLSDPSEKAVADNGQNATVASSKKLDDVGTSKCVVFHTARLPLPDVFCCFTIQVLGPRHD